MKIDFRKIEVKDLDCNTSTVDVSKVLGNMIYRNTPDLGELEIAKSIYHDGEVELSPEQVEQVKKYVSFNYAHVTAAVMDALQEVDKEVVVLSE